LTHRSLSRISILALVAMIVGIVLAAPAANAQDVAAADQYTPSGGGGGGQNPAGGGGHNGGGNGAQNPAGGGGGGGAQNPDNGGGAVSPAGGGGAEPSATVGEKGGGGLPFTGYPLTPLVWIVVGLLVAGIAVRLVSGAVRRNSATAS
jgi:hypothetical protein